MALLTDSSVKPIKPFLADFDIKAAGAAAAVVGGRHDLKSKTPPKLHNREVSNFISIFMRTIATRRDLGKDKS